MQNAILRRDDVSISGEQGHAVEDGQLLWMDVERGRMAEVWDYAEGNVLVITCYLGS